MQYEKNNPCSDCRQESGVIRIPQIPGILDPFVSHVVSAGNRVPGGSGHLVPISLYIRGLEAFGFHYSVNGGKGSYRKSKEKRRVTNCAIYVSWALQDAGIIKKGQVFWIDKGGAIRGKRKTCITKNNKLKILHPHKKAKHAGLKKGDICGWDSHIHTAVYAGRDALSLIHI